MLAQLGLFNEAELAVDAEEKAGAPAIEIAAHTRTPRGRKPLPAWIPRVEVLHDLAESEKTCPHDGTPLARIGEDACEQLELIPAEPRVVRHVRPKYACPSCHAGVHTAPLPPQPVRQERSRPVIEALRGWLTDALPRIAPQTLTGKALAYLDHQWPKLVRVLDDGRVPLDTNAVENAIRPFVVGRKNWLFADRHRPRR